MWGKQMDLLGKPAGPSAYLRELGSWWHCYLSMTKQLKSSLRAYSGSRFEWTQSVLERHAWQLDQETAGYIVSAVRKQRVNRQWGLFI